MRRITIDICIVLGLSSLLLVSICSAQQATDNKYTNSARDASPGGIAGPVIGGNGTRNFIPIWATPNFLLSSVIYQDASNSIGIGTTTPTAKLDVNGNLNTATTYGIGGSTVVNIGSPADGNLFLGVGAGSNNVGVDNVFVGYRVAPSNMSSRNTFLGAFAGTSNTGGNENSFVGDVAGGNNTSGEFNSFLGSNAGYANTSGSFNIFLGWEAGSYNRTGNYNIYIGNYGGTSGTENTTIRIGDPVTHTAVYIAGIYGSTSSSGVPVYINSNGQLGTSPSSLRFKEQVRDMGDSTNGLMKLRPVTFLYKPEYDKDDRILQYGLIAEEVARVYPELVANDQDGQPYTVRYQYITTMLLNEVQKQYHRAEAEASVITTQEQKIDSQQQQIEGLKQQLQVQNATVQERLTRLEALARVEVATAAK